MDVHSLQGAGSDAPRGDGALNGSRGRGLWVLSFLLGCLVGAILFQAFQRIQSQSARHVNPLATPAREVLASLGQSVAVHLYTGLGDHSVPQQDRNFAQRVEALLLAMEQHAKGRLVIVRHKVATPEEQSAAVDAGLQPFHLDKGAAAFLGIVVEGPGGRKTLARLDPVWEPALQFDLVRAIAEVARLPAVHSLTSESPDEAAISEVRQLVGEPNAVTMEEGADRLRQAAVEAFRQAAQGFQARQQDLQRRFREAEARADLVTQRALLDELRRLQVEQATELQRLADRLQTQLQVWQQLKANAPVRPNGGEQASPPDAGGDSPLSHIEAENKGRLEAR
ncbi:MAG: hypothetical protein NZM03_12400 [Limisphaera sp.]|nr:hypothetical protein [Limisphaera sp.]